MSTRHVVVVLALSIALTAACSADPATLESTSPSQTEPDQAAATQSGELGARIDTLAPVRTRDGRLRFVNAALRSPDAAPVLLARLAAGQDPPEVRVALAEAVGRTRGDYAAPVADALATETDPDVRVQLVASLARAGRTSDAAAHVQRGLTAALADQSSLVREEAAHAAASHPVGIALAPELATAAADEYASVRAAAVRALGILSIDDQLELLRLSTGDPSPDVRLEALRALERIDPEVARSVAISATLSADPDPRIQRVATELSTDH